MASLVDPVSQSAILGYHQSALVCILGCSIKYRGHDEKTTSSRNYCTADGNIGISPINQSCGWLLRWRWDVCRKSLLLVWDYVRHPSVPGQNFAKSSAREGYTRLQGIRILQTAEAAVKKLFLSGIATLFLATGTAHAQREGGAFFGPFSRGDSSGASGQLRKCSARANADEKAFPSRYRCAVPGAPGAVNTII